MRFLLFYCLFLGSLYAAEPKDKADKLLEAVEETQCLVAEVRCLVEQILYGDIACFDCSMECTNV